MRHGVPVKWDARLFPKTGRLKGWELYRFNALRI